MPVIIVNARKIDIDKKREYVKKLTELTSVTYNLPESAVTVLIKEIEAENIAVSGKLLSETE
jgi:4-oxalocrotonate tautomerase